MKSYERLKDMLCEELEKLAKKGELSAGSLDLAHKLTDTIKNLDKISMLEGEDGYSEASDWMGEGRMYGMSYARGRGRNAKRDSMGRYSREGGYSSEGQSYEGGQSYAGGPSYAGSQSYARGRSGSRMSYDDGKEYMVEQIEEIMETADPKSREALKRAIKQIENA